MSAIDVENTYRKWWQGKYCRIMGSRGPFKLVDDVKFHGPPSGVYGSASLRFADGSQTNIPCGKAFKPRKMDVEVWPRKEPPPKHEIQDHVHEFTVLFDEQDGRLFAFCGIGDCDYEIDADEIERRVNVVEQLRRNND